VALDEAAGVAVPAVVVQRPTGDHGVVGPDVGPLAGGSDIDLQTRGGQSVADHLGDPGGAAHLGAVGHKDTHYSPPRVVTTCVVSVVATGLAGIGQTARCSGDPNSLNTHAINDGPQLHQEMRRRCRKSRGT
jgi:hypothetical protein